MSIHFYLGMTLMLFLFAAMMVEAYYEKRIIGFTTSKQKNIYRYSAILSILVFIIITIITIKKII